MLTRRVTLFPTHLPRAPKRQRAGAVQTLRVFHTTYPSPASTRVFPISPRERHLPRGFFETEVLLTLISNSRVSSLRSETRGRPAVHPYRYPFCLSALSSQLSSPYRNTAQSQPKTASEAIPYSSPIRSQLVRGRDGSWVGRRQGRGDNSPAMTRNRTDDEQRPEFDSVRDDHRKQEHHMPEPYPAPSDID